MRIVLAFVLLSCIAVCYGGPLGNINDGFRVISVYKTSDADNIRLKRGHGGHGGGHGGYGGGYGGGHGGGYGGGYGHGGGHGGGHYGGGHYGGGHGHGHHHG